MARGRLISRTLGSSRKFSSAAREAGRLGEFVQVLYPLLIANTDDFGRLSGDAFTVKHAVFPTSPRKEPEFDQALQAMQIAGLIQRYEADGVQVIEIVEFEAHQPGLSKRTRSKFPGPPVNFTGIPTQLNRTEEKGTEEKRTEEKGTAPPAPARATLEQPLVDQRSHRSHAYCGRPCAPDFLHRQFVDQLGTAVPDPDAVIRQFYRDRSAQLAEDAVIANPVKFWETAFAEFARSRFPAAVGTPIGSAGRSRQSPSHTPADVDKYAGITRGLDADE